MGRKLRFFIPSNLLYSIPPVSLSLVWKSLNRFSERNLWGHISTPLLCSHQMWPSLESFTTEKSSSELEFYTLGLFYPWLSKHQKVCYLVRWTGYFWLWGEIGIVYCLKRLICFNCKLMQLWRKNWAVKCKVCKWDKAVWVSSASIQRFAEKFGWKGKMMPKGVQWYYMQEEHALYLKISLQSSDLPLSGQERYEDIAMDSTKKTSVRLQL